MVERQSRGDKARSVLLKAAREQLGETGQLEVAAVSRRAGVSDGLPYRYFGSRSGLLISVLDDFYARLADAATMRTYEARSWVEREQQRIHDWVAALYADPLAPIVLGGLVGDAEVAAANTRHLHNMIEVGARNIAVAQREGEIPSDRDPELLAALALGGTSAVVAVALTRTPRPSPDSIAAELWTAVRGAVGVAETPNKK